MSLMDGNSQGKKYGWTAVICTASAFMTASLPVAAMQEPHVASAVNNAVITVGHAVKLPEHNSCPS